MNVLAFDTCFDACSVAVRSRAKGEVWSERRLMRRGHAEELLPMIDRTMKRAGLGFVDIGRIIVTHGPGTFTGTRVTIAAARGLALSHGIPTVTCSSLLPIALASLAAGGAGIGPFSSLIVARNAKRGLAYAQLFDMAGGERSAPALVKPDDLLAMAGTDTIFFTGSATSVVTSAAATSGRASIATWPGGPPEGIDEPDAKFLLDVATRLRPMGMPEPLYLRPPDATPASSAVIRRALGS